MSLRRITISVSEEIALKAQRAVDSGLAASVSAYFAGLAAREPDWATAASTIEMMIDEAGGLSESDREWAQMVLGGGEASASPAA